MPADNSLLHELDSLKELNSALQSTLGTLINVSENLSQLQDNLGNSKALAKTHTEIHEYNRNLTETLMNTLENGDTVDPTVLDQQILSLNDQIAAMNSQIAQLKKASS